MQCQVCQIPMLFTEPCDPLTLCQRHAEYKGEQYHFCSDHCRDIFEDEPEKFIQSKIAGHEVFKGNAFRPGTDPTAEGFNPAAEALAFFRKIGIASCRERVCQYG